MPIRDPYEAECCLCSKFFMSKQELDAHDRLYATEHNQALAKGHRDFAKSAEKYDPEINMVLGHSDLEREQTSYEVAKAAVAPLGELFDEDTRWRHQRGEGSGCEVKYSQLVKGEVDPQFADLVTIGRW
jgi:hypothetical protein